MNKYEEVHSTPDMFDLFCDVYPHGSCGYSASDINSAVSRIKNESQSTSMLLGPYGVAKIILREFEKMKASKMEGVTL